MTLSSFFKLLWWDLNFQCEFLFEYIQFFLSQDWSLTSCCSLFIIYQLYSSHSCDPLNRHEALAVVINDCVTQVIIGQCILWKTLIRHRKMRWKWRKLLARHGSLSSTMQVLLWIQLSVYTRWISLKSQSYISIFHFLSLCPVQCINNPTGVPRMFVPTPAFKE